jgi:hypothetical protein
MLEVVDKYEEKEYEEYETEEEEEEETIFNPFLGVWYSAKTTCPVMSL